MKLNNFALREGKIVYVPDVPKKPHFLEDATDHAQYKTSLAFAIVSGIEVDNFDETEDALLDAHATGHGFRLEEGKLYSLQCRVEKRVIYEPCNNPKCDGDGFVNHFGAWVFCDTCKGSGVINPKTVARVTFEQPEKKPCGNCKETVDPCACMRNKCVNCGGPVGNITFSLCDNCWDLRHNKPEAAGQEQEMLSREELDALKSVGIIAENWYAVSYNENAMPYALFQNEEYAKAYRDKFSATSVITPWPMVVKDYRKQWNKPSTHKITRKRNELSGSD